MIETGRGMRTRASVYEGKCRRISIRLVWDESSSISENCHYELEAPGSLGHIWCGDRRGRDFRGPFVWGVDQAAESVICLAWQGEL
jgi:hypothetical protein